MWISCIFFIYWVDFILASTTHNSSNYSAITIKTSSSSLSYNKKGKGQRRYSRNDYMTSYTQIPSYMLNQVQVQLPNTQPASVAVPAHKYPNANMNPITVVVAYDKNGNNHIAQVFQHQLHAQYVHVNGYTYILYPLVQQTFQSPQPQQQLQLSRSQIDHQLLFFLISNALISQPLSCYASVYNPKSFLFELYNIPAARNLSASKHLDCLVEFLIKLENNSYRQKYEDNALDYFSYIMEYHLSHEAKLKHFENVLLPYIYKLIAARCRLPEIIGPMLRLISPTLSHGNRIYLHTKLEVSIYANVKLLTRTEFNRYVEVIELFCELVQVPPHYNDHVKDVQTVNYLWIIYKFTPIYRNLLGLLHDPTNMITNFVSEHFQPENDIGPPAILTLKYYSALDFIFKRVLRRTDSPEKRDQLNNIISNTLNGLHPDAIYLVAAYRFTSLLDALLSYRNLKKDKESNREQEQVGLDFKEFVRCSFDFNDASKSLRYVSMFIAYNPISLQDFRYESALLELEGIDHFFLKAVEVIVAAVDGIKCLPHFYMTWEPSIDFLLLQREILNFPHNGNHVTIFDTSYLSEAASVFLVRQTGLSYSNFLTSSEWETISWNDMLSLVKFHFARLSPEMAEGVELNSILCKHFPSDINAMIQFLLQNGNEWKGSVSIDLSLSDSDGSESETSSITPDDSGSN